jgi:hypothetical protein
MNNEEETRLKENQRVIREYLLDQFKGCKLTDTPDRPFGHKFTVMKLKPLEQYKLLVSWPQISDSSNTPEKIKRLLVTEGVANKMRATPKGEYFEWGSY